MKELDFLFVYEHKVRELENLCLAKYELDRRGYRTEIAYIEDAANALAATPTMHAKVLCMMACYNNHTIRWHTKHYATFDKIIDLQWENIVYPKDEEREGAFKNYKEIGSEVVHVSWGAQNVARLSNAAHIDPKKIKLVGHMGMDFLRAPLNRYYMSKEDLFKKYDIPMDSRTVFFASPYYGDQLSEEYIADMCSRFGDNWTEYYDFMCRSQEIVIGWFEALCKEDPNLQVIYRPHPGHPSKIAQETAERCSNFRLIGGESVKQWILACDRVYTGNSSVPVEAFFAQKQCYLVFPMPITEGFKLQLLDDSEEIHTAAEMKETIYSDAKECGEHTAVNGDFMAAFCVPRQNIEGIYRIDWEKPNYVHFADMAEEVLKDPYYALTKEQIKSIDNSTGIQKMINLACRIKPLYAIYLKLIDSNLKWGFLEGQRALRQRAIQNELDHAHEVTSPEEIDAIIGRIKAALEG